MLHNIDDVLWKDDKVAKGNSGRLVIEIGDRIIMELKIVSKVSKAWEDNVGTQNLANSEVPLMKSRTKYIGIKWHWFRSKIQPDYIDMLRNDAKQ